jgi:hypothetical protein
MTGKPGKTCTICASPDLIAIQKAITENVPLLDIAARFPAVKKSALSRHSINHMGRKGTGGHASRGSGIRPPKGPARKSHSADGRCSACGVAVDKPEPEMLLKRAERLMFYAETVAERAAQDDDYRLQLQAIDRARQALELTMKAVGMLAPENLTIIDQRQQVNQFVGWPTASLQALTDFAAALESGATVSEACEAVQGQGNAPALPPGRSDEGEAA